MPVAGDTASPVCPRLPTARCNDEHTGNRWDEGRARLDNPPSAPPPRWGVVTTTNILGIFSSYDKPAARLTRYDSAGASDADRMLAHGGAHDHPWDSRPWVEKSSLLQWNSHLSDGALDGAGIFGNKFIIAGGTNPRNPGAL